MDHKLPLSYFLKLFPTDDSCIDEIKKLRYPKGVACTQCKKITKHYKINNRTAYACEYCRNHVYPLRNTIFEKTTTPLSLWFYCMFLMTHTRGKISIRTLQKEMRVTYKTSWRMYHAVKSLMARNNADLLSESQEVLAVNFFNAFDIKVVEKQERL